MDTYALEAVNALHISGGTRISPVPSAMAVTVPLDRLPAEAAPSSSDWIHRELRTKRIVEGTSVVAQCKQWKRATAKLLADAIGDDHDAAAAPTAVLIGPEGTKWKAQAQPVAEVAYPVCPSVRSLMWC